MVGAFLASREVLEGAMEENTGPDYNKMTQTGDRGLVRRVASWPGRSRDS